MKRVKVIIKRPKIHYVISLVYILAPIVNIIGLIVIARLPLNMIINRLFQGYGYLAGIWLLTAPLVGIGLYFVHKVSWYIFLAHSGLILVDYILKWALKPILYWRTVPGIHQFLIFTGNLALVAIIGYIIQRDFRAPYFQVLKRSWRESKRVPIRHCITLKGETRSINDISTTGCFVSEPDIGLEPGEKVPISFQAAALTIACRGEVMRIIPDGYGIRFISLSLAQRRDIRRMIKTRYALRYQVELSGSWLFNEHRIAASVLNISNSGCLIQAEVSRITEKLEGKLEIEERRHRHILAGSIVWINRTEMHEKPVGFAVRFTKNQRRLVTRIVSQYGSQELTR